MLFKKGEKIKSAYQSDFRWDVLLRQIKRKQVIPVIGHGLYRVNVESEGKNNYLLYDYLAEQVAAKCGMTIQADENHKFAKACFQFLKKNNHFGAYLDLFEILNEILEDVRLVSDNSLCKLARIKNFDMFINTAYDDFLANSINSVRRSPTKPLSYARTDKNFDSLNPKLFDSNGKLKCTLVYHIFGNFDDNAPAYTESDILETLMQFNKDMETNPNTTFFKKLGESCLLFIGCNFDDWLFRFFIRILSNQSYSFFQNNHNFKLIAGNYFCNNKKDPFYDLLRFLRANNVMDCFPTSGEDFIDLLFEQMERDYSNDIIQPSDSPYTAFISFEGKDREAAQLLTDNLKKDGLVVWLDEREFKGGDDVDKKIINTIDRCSVFIPLVSRNSKQLLTDEGKLRYHIREWQQAYNKTQLDDKKLTIIPVTIDDIDWKSDKGWNKFDDLYYYKIPGGNRLGDYENLKNQLIEKQKENSVII